MVPVSLLGSELEGESSRIAGSVGRSRFTTDSGESGRGTARVSNLGENVGLAEIGDVVGYLGKTALVARTTGSQP